MSVIDDVIEKMRQVFLDADVSESVVYDLKAVGRQRHRERALLSLSLLRQSDSPFLSLPLSFSLFPTVKIPSVLSPFVPLVSFVSPLGSFSLWAAQLSISISPAS
jgi:hypothetical protein